ncbi:MutS-related protein [Maribacter halichondriae]|uniref:MutS-related protein n=1 Tax=Maribacter halichondriae TaxID=2980554 RepID=UPI002359662C|nr:DNA mismatch repair protein MutS [Maribacter sp. Hal144]
MQGIDLTSYYQDQIQKHEVALAKVKQDLSGSSLLRLLLFVLTAFGIYLSFGNTRLILAILILGLALFLYLVSRHTDLQYTRDKLQALVKLNQTEIMVLRREFHQLPEGNEYKDPLHYFSQDIDLFGRGSFYQYLNRTALQQGSETLAHLLAENSIDDILEKQKAIEELSKMPEWRKEFTAIASLVKTETKYSTIIKWMEHHKPFIPSIMKVLPLLVSIISGLLFLGFFMDFVSGWIVTGWFFVGLGITGRYLKPINKLSSDTGKIQSTFLQYQKLIVELEVLEFKSSLLQKKRESIIHETERTSKTLKKFAKLLNALDQRNNVIISIFANAFLLRDLQLSHAIEQWIRNHGSKNKEWFETIAFFDAYNSLGNFTFNHPTYVFPRLSDEDIVLRSKEAGHPLLPLEKCVTNDFQINKEQFFIITGANMAGKSTFLRTVSLHIVMANVGLPVCSKAFKYSPIKLITSMRTTDSLTDDESYFFSELKRLKFIVDEIQNDNYFIVLDEILKGTNSTDKAKGSRKFVERLVGSKSTGIIATHDLSLCKVAQEFPEIENHYFDAEIIDNELHFDYKFKEGICQNMNASFLLKKMGIVD